MQTNRNWAATLCAALNRPELEIRAATNDATYDYLPQDEATLLALNELYICKRFLEYRDDHVIAIPETLAKLQNLRTLTINRCKLPIVPAAIFQLAALRELTLVFDQLENIPAEIGQLKHLEILTLHANHLNTLPAEIGKLAQLKTLGLDDNRLTSLPPEIGALNKLQQLFLGGQQRPERNTRRRVPS